MPTRQHVFPLDLTMTLASNRVVNEVKEFTTPADRLFVPNAGPFYTESMIIKTASGRLLQPITEYKLLYMNEDATLASNRNVCTVIQILNESINGLPCLNTWKMSEFDDGSHDMNIMFAPRQREAMRKVLGITNDGSI